MHIQPNADSSAHYNIGGIPLEISNKKHSNLHFGDRWDDQNAGEEAEWIDANRVRAAAPPEPLPLPLLEWKKIRGGSSRSSLLGFSLRFMLCKDC